MSLVTRRATAAILVLSTVVACDDASDPTGPPPVASVDVTPTRQDVWERSTSQLTAIPRDARGDPLDGRAVTWHSSNDDVATVSPGGLVEARGVGEVTITATSEGKVGEATITVSSYELMFQGQLTGLPEIFVLDLDGGEPRRVLPPYTLVTAPEPSPDGRQILYVIADYDASTGDIYVVGRDGTDTRQLTFHPELDDEPAWSPDGSRIAMVSWRAGQLGDIWVMNADGSGEPKNITPDPLPAVTDEHGPSWSPDGERIVYASSQGSVRHLWVVDADGGNRRQLTFGTTSDSDPAWSPDGTTIAFRRTNEMGSDIWVVSAAGGEPIRLPHEGDDAEPAWSPDGRLLAFESHPPHGGSPQLYTMRPDGSDIRLRTTDYRWNGGRKPKFLKVTAR